MLRLRDYEQSDIQHLVTLANNENVSRFLTARFPFPYTNKDARWWIDEGCKVGVTKVIEYESTFVGTVGAVSKDLEHCRTAVIGYWLGQPFWGKGLAHRALIQLTDYMFDNTNIVRLEADIFSPNLASMKVAEKAGYHCEAVLRKAIYKHQQFYDQHLYVRLKPNLD